MKGHLIVYKASAGSGKTYTLAAQYIALLLSGDPRTYRNILAVTFTNKATGEMKERILQRLYDLSNHRDADFAATVCQMQPMLNEAEAARRAGAALSAIIHDYDRFSVKTIDAFFQSLLTNLARELGLAANFKVHLDDKEVIEAAVDRMMQEIENRPEVAQWVLSYINQRIDDNNKWDISKELKSFGLNLLNGNYMRHEEALREILSSSERLKRYRQELSELESQTGEEASQAANELITDVEAHSEIKVSYVKDLFSYLSRIAAADFYKAPGSRVQGWLEAAENWLKKADRKHGDWLVQTEEWRENLQWIEAHRQLAARVGSSCSLSKQYINPLRLLNVIAAHMNDINNENNRFMLAKTPQLFNRLVRNEDASFVFEKAGTTFRHVMIDEFQDTSHMQWSNFKKLLIENMATGNECLLVGDVKQSIYRWRGGDWDILQNVEREFPTGRIDVHTLDTNYRSARAIVAFNNAFFKRAAELLDELTRVKNEAIAGLETSGGQKPAVKLADIYADVAQNVRKGAKEGYVKVCFAEKPERGGTSNDDVMLEALAEEIGTLHEKGVAFNDMGILVRRNGSATAILNYFSEHHPEIAVASDEAFLLSSSPAVMMLVNALRYLNDKTHSIALTTLARSYTRYVRHAEADWTMLTKQPLDLLPTEFSAERPKLKALPLFELCERLIKMFEPEKVAKFGEAPAAASQGQAAYLYCFMDHVLAFLEDSPSDLSKFLAHWDEVLCKKSIPAAGVDCIRILTIHKSKGLAFHTVLLPFCEWALEEDRDSVLWCEPSEAPYNALPLVPVGMRKSAAVKQSIYAADYANEHLQQRIDNLNLLYVALTRAKMNLVVMATRTVTKMSNGETDDEAELEGAFAGVAHLLHRCVDVAGMAKTELCEAGEENGVCEVWQRGEVIATNDEDATATDNAQTPPAADTEAASTAENQPKGNPLEYAAEARGVCFEQNESRMTFRQSNSANDFISDEPDPATQFIGRGKLLHLLFSEIHTAADLEGAMAKLALQGYIADKAEAENIEKLARKRLASDYAREWFDGSWTLYNECSILWRDEAGKLKVRRPDRVMIKRDAVVVVDFKFGNEAPKYDDQIKDYIKILRTMGYNNVKGYLWYVYKNQVVSFE